MERQTSSGTIPIPVRPRPTCVVYRATLPSGREGALYPSIGPDDATMADAWNRWNGICPGIDPRTLEIEIRQPSGRRWHAAR